MAFSAGLLIDFGIGDALGFHGIMLGVACYVISALSANLLRTNLLTSFLVNTVSLLVIVVLQWLFYYVLYGYDYILYALLHHYLPRIAYSLVLTPITFYFKPGLCPIDPPRRLTPFFPCFSERRISVKRFSGISRYIICSLPFAGSVQAPTLCACSSGRL